MGDLEFADLDKEAALQRLGNAVSARRFSSTWNQRLPSLNRQTPVAGDGNSITTILKYRCFLLPRERHTLMGFFAKRFLSGGGIYHPGDGLPLQRRDSDPPTHI